MNCHNGINLLVKKIDVCKLTKLLFHMSKYFGGLEGIAANGEACCCAGILHIADVTLFCHAL